MGIDVNRERAIDLALSQIEKQFGKGAIMKLGEGGQVADIPALPTGSLGLDIALGIGGMPRGRFLGAQPVTEAVRERHAGRIEVREPPRWGVTVLTTRAA